MLYPEQNEARLKLSLDGTWAFALGSCVEDQFDPAKPLPDAQPIAVPASYNDQNDQTTALRRHYGWAWYQRKVTLPTFCAGQRVVLRFGSVTHTAKVWLNGQLIAQHKGGFTPFEADVTALLRPGETVLLTVACDNRVNHSTLPVGNEDGQLAFFGSDNAGIPSVEAAKREIPDLILMDVVMPNLNGFQATRSITREPTTKHIPVILVTTKDQDTDRMWGMRQGARAYITKPFSEEQLAEVIERVFGQGAVAAPPAPPA